MPDVSHAAIDKFYAHVGKKVRFVRSSASMSQSVLAKQIGVTRSSIANLEAGRQRIALHLLAQIAIALNVDMATLLPSLSVFREEDVLTGLEEHLAEESESAQMFVRRAIAQLQRSDGRGQNSETY